MPDTAETTPKAADQYWWTLTVDSHAGMPIILTFEGNPAEAYLDAGEARAIALALNNAADAHDRAHQRTGTGLTGHPDGGVQTVFRHGRAPAAH
jgi:hypothetical protein